MYLNSPLAASLAGWLSRTPLPRATHLRDYQPQHCKHGSALWIQSAHDASICVGQETIYDSSQDRQWTNTRPNSQSDLGNQLQFPCIQPNFIVDIPCPPMRSVSAQCSSGY